MKKEGRAIRSLVQSSNDVYGLDGAATSSRRDLSRSHRRFFLRFLPRSLPPHLCFLLSPSPSPVFLLFSLFLPASLNETRLSQRRSERDGEGEEEDQEKEEKADVSQL